MKRYFILLFALAGFASSCTKNSLEITPSNQLSDATVWNTPATANLFLNDIYNQLNPGPYGANSYKLPSEISNDPLECYTDNATYGPSAGNESYLLFDNDSYGPANDMFSPTWVNMYTAIRKCNLAIEKVAASNFPDVTKKSMTAQARFLRAYFYKQLIDIYGGVPLITTVLDNTTQGDAIFYPRSTYADCVSFIQTECTAAATDLPQKVTGTNVGYATWGAAMALKGEEELYAGKWADAVATHQQIMSSNLYSLFPDYNTLFFTGNENNQEVLFDIQYAANIRPKKVQQYWGVPMVAKGQGWGGNDPTQNLVDQYELTDGKTAAQGSALYDATRPYSNLDKRFYATVIYDGEIWRGAPVYTRLGIANNANQINVVNLQGNAGRTGYFVKKYMDSTLTSGPNNLDGTNYIVWRYGEVLLNYAEAKNELSGPDQSIYDAINLLRKRGGLPNLPTGLTQATMRTAIQHERRIELAFEGKYFYDIMRWKTAESLFSQPIYGMQVTTVAGKLVYTRVQVRKIKFNAAKNYLQPIPQAVIDQNPKMTQNPNY
ncbi:MAG: RagB/SusD family nutrient uptake outer membrane protein [Bacteroidota bacterium]